MPLPKTREEAHRDEMLEAHEQEHRQGTCHPNTCWVCEEDASNPVYTGEQARDLLNEAVQIVRKILYNRVCDHINSEPLEHAISDINAAILDLKEYK